MIKKLRRKLVLTNMALALAMLAIICLLVYQFSAADLKKSEKETLTSAATLPLRPDFDGHYEGEFPCFTLRINSFGELLIMGNNSYGLSDIDRMGEIYMTALKSGKSEGVLQEYGLRFLRVDSMDGPVFAFVGAEHVAEALAELLQTLAIVGSLCLLGFFGISILLARWAVKPVAEAWDKQRQFVADASHELKTPLTVVLTNAELLQQAHYSAEEKDRFAENILSTGQQMRHLVEGLLQLARSDSGASKAAYEPLDFSALAEDAALPFEPAYFENGMTLTCCIAPGIRVSGNSGQLKQVIDILLDNGLKYAAPAANVILELAHYGKGKCVLTVFTPGAPLSEEACENIFKRFYRLDEARTDRSSYGLGLSIARQLVTEHDGNIWAKGFSTGNAFYVILPEI